MFSYHPYSRRRFKRRRRAFTLIELLVVIGIILILVGLFFGGAKIVTAQAKERDTKTMLQTCKSMFENYRQDTKLTRYPASLLGFGPNFTPTATTWYTGQEAAIGSVSTDALGLNPPPQTITSSASSILYDTACVFEALEALPENQTMMANIPGNKKISLNLVQVTGATTTTTQVTLFLDGWGNVILFVPGGGLGENIANGLVSIDGTNQGIITSTQIITPSTTPPVSTYSPAAVGAAPSSNQPFFVSAGPDGILNNGTSSDDNLYSFQ
jgi:prepilin-type N-terminal cleavage/methylation domain-containing protein